MDWWMFAVISNVPPGLLATVSKLAPVPNRHDTLAFTNCATWHHLAHVLENTLNLLTDQRYPQTSCATSITNFNFFHCSSSVKILPSSVEAKPH